MMNYPQELRYTKSHEWVRFFDDSTATVGLTEYAQDSMGDLVFVGLPAVGDQVEAGQSFADVESVKTASDVYCPVTGTVAEVNEALLDAPELINSEPYSAWIAKLENITQKAELLSAEEYSRFVEEEGR